MFNNRVREFAIVSPVYVFAIVLLMLVMFALTNPVSADSPPEPELRFRFGFTCNSQIAGDVPAVLVQSIDEASRFNGRIARFESDFGMSWLPVMGESGNGNPMWAYVMSAITRGLNEPGLIDVSGLIGREGNAWLKQMLSAWADAGCYESGWLRTDMPGVTPDDPFVFAYAMDDATSLVAEGSFPGGGFDMAYVYLQSRGCHTWTIARSSGERYDFIATYTSAVLNGQDGTGARWSVPESQQESYDAFLADVRLTHPTCAPQPAPAAYIVYAPMLARN